MQDNRLTNLLTYTVFHIGVYISLVSGFIAASAFGDLSGIIMKWGVGCFFLAGVCGAVIGSNIPDHTSYDEYLKKHIGFWNIEILKAKYWITLEHIFFWLGITPVVLAFIICGVSAFGVKPNNPL
ncbi:hypothetical protein ACE414_11035 [Alteromonas macleodii]|uniref:hypothetical protein n=1 Tax=Alteromonas macleodii TaxID=28108 RepID=UPI00365CB058